jgi:hypothetical protein
MTNIVNFNLRVIVGNQVAPLNYLEEKLENPPPANGILLPVIHGLTNSPRKGLNNATAARGRKSAIKNS